MDDLHRLDTAFPERRLALPGGAVLGLRRTAGTGMPWLLLHGISSGAASWSGVAAALAAHGADVIAWDAPGYGDSTPLPIDAPTAADYAARTAALLDTLAVPRVHLVGHSLGALVAAALAAQLGTARIASLTLVSPARGYGGDAAAAERIRTQRLTALHEQGIAGLAARLHERLLTAEASEAQRALLQATALRLTERGYAQAVELLVGSDLAALAQPLPPDLPLRVIVGGADVVTPPAACEALAAQAGAPFTVLPGAPHALPVQQPDALAAVLRAPLPA